MYRLDNTFAATAKWSVAVVGCGGTGGYVADSLCRLLPLEAQLYLIDHDRVEERNLGRQNFLEKELGKFKSEALALRLSARYGRTIAYSVMPISMSEVKLPGLIIGCLDNGPARRVISNITGMVGSPYGDTSWWIDAGNGDNYGQVLIGNSKGDTLFKDDICLTLPMPTIQSPVLLMQAPERHSCADMDEQGPTINQAIASLVVETARRIIEGTCPWMQLYLDLESGSLRSVIAAPETAKRISKVKILKGGEA